jgi:hypothetical protein
MVFIKKNIIIPKRGKTEKLYNYLIIDPKFRRTMELQIFLRNNFNNIFKTLNYE